MNTEIMQRLARRLGISLAEAFELEDKNVELFDFFEVEIGRANMDGYQEGYDEASEEGH